MYVSQKKNCVALYGFLGGITPKFHKDFMKYCLDEIVLFARFVSQLRYEVSSRR